MTTFRNFGIKKETSSAKRVVKIISEAKNTNNVSMCVYFINSRMKSLKM